MALQESFDALKAEADAIKAEVVDTNAKIDVSIALIQSLKDQIANGGVVTAAQLDEVTASLKGDETSLSDKSDQLPQT